MKKGYKRFSAVVREKVLEASEVSGWCIPPIAIEYGVPEHTVRRWQKERKKLSSIVAQADEVNQFVEVSLEKVVSQTMVEKASLTIGGISVMIEGRMRSASLIGIIKIMEETC